jgi:peptidoglycan/LPS O-acetylase OafA/YrhL
MAEKWQVNFLMQCLVAFSLTSLFSFVSYKFIERPILKYKSKFTLIESRKA